MEQLGKYLAPLNGVSRRSKATRRPTADELDRRDLGLSQAELGHLLGWSQSRVSEYERSHTHRPADEAAWRAMFDHLRQTQPGGGR